MVGFMKKITWRRKACAAALTAAMTVSVSPAHAQSSMPADPVGAALNGAIVGSTDVLHQSTGATMFASFYSTGYLSPLWPWSGAAAEAARCADTITGSSPMSSQNGGVRFAAAVACIVPNPRLSAALDAQFRETGHF